MDARLHRDRHGVPAGAHGTTLTPAHQDRSERSQSLGEEIANSVSHGVGLLASLAAIPMLLAAAIRRGDSLDVVGASVFAVTVVLLYTASTLYHALPHNKAKHVFRPFTLGALRGPWGWTLLGLVWGLAICGIVLTALAGFRYPRLAMGVYLGMGWLMIIAIKPLWMHVPLPGVLWLLAGGLAYSAGMVFLRAGRMRYAHFIWHVFVLVGSTCHFVAVLRYAPDRPCVSERCRSTAEHACSHFSRGTASCLPSHSI
jgi:hemolysin III